MLFKLFFNNIRTDLSYVLFKYLQYKNVRKIFEVGCLHQHTVIFIAQIGMKLLKFLCILVRTVHFTDRNSIFKSVYCIKMF